LNFLRSSPDLRVGERRFIGRAGYCPALVHIQVQKDAEFPKGINSMIWIFADVQVMLVEVSENDG